MLCIKRLQNQSKVKKQINMNQSNLHFLLELYRQHRATYP